jgi:hypothetical protein
MDSEEEEEEEEEEEDDNIWKDLFASFLKHDEESVGDGNPDVETGSTECNVRSTCNREFEFDAAGGGWTESTAPPCCCNRLVCWSSAILH